MDHNALHSWFAGADVLLVDGILLAEGLGQHLQQGEGEVKSSSFREICRSIDNVVYMIIPQAPYQGFLTYNKNQTTALKKNLSF